jgi:predicted TIM-barrel fold metal-dependent hydrolase
MYRAPDGEEYFVIDGHVHYWDASPANQKNRHGEEFVNCFHDYQKGLGPEEYVWPDDKFRKYDKDTMLRDLFEIGYDDMAIFQPTYLKDFYFEGFNTTERNAILKEEHPERFILNGSFDPREGEAGLGYLDELVEKYQIQGIKLYTAEWRGESRGWSLHDDWAYRYLEKCQQLGIKNIHIHKGPTILPLDRDAFDVSDVDHVATDFPNLNFIIEHVGLPRLDDFCWIAVQEPNVYGGLAVAMPFVHARPRYFGQIMTDLLFYLDENRLLFGSDYAIWHPKWIIEKFVDYQLPEDMAEDTGITLTPEIKRKILGENAAALYGIDIEVKKVALGQAADVAEAK